MRQRCRTKVETTTYKAWKTAESNKIKATPDKKATGKQDVDENLEEDQDVDEDGPQDEEAESEGEDMEVDDDALSEVHTKPQTLKGYDNYVHLVAEPQLKDPMSNIMKEC